MDSLDAEMDDLDNKSTSSSVELLLKGVQDAFQRIAESAETTENTYIVQKDVIHNAMHAFTDLMDAIDNGILRDNPVPDTTPSSIRFSIDSP